jgi:hypothetical protein
MVYQAVIFDIKGSRRLSNRQEVQYQLIDAIKQVNEKYSDTIVSDFIITIGDEWQGLLKYPADYQQIIDAFKLILGIEFYCGVGIGEITVNDFELTVNQLDGPAFYMARDAIKKAKLGNKELVEYKDYIR